MFHNNYKKEIFKSLKKLKKFLRLFPAKKYYLISELLKVSKNKLKINKMIISHNLD